MPNTVMKVDVTARIATLTILCLTTIAAQVFVMPTFAAIYQLGNQSLPLGTRLAIEAMGVISHPIVTVLLFVGIGYMLWKKWGDAAQRMAVVGVASLVFALILVGQASLLIDLALLRVRLGS